MKTPFSNARKRLIVTAAFSMLVVSSVLFFGTEAQGAEVPCHTTCDAPMVSEYCGTGVFECWELICCATETCSGPNDPITRWCVGESV